MSGRGISTSRFHRLSSPLVAAAIIAVSALIAYARTFTVPFVGDDVGAIVENVSIRNLFDLRAVLSPPATEGLTVGGRPVLNLTLAINYAISGPAVWSYHVVNLLIHASAALLIFGIARRTLAFGPPGRGMKDDWQALALTVAWLLHPMQTESVTYVVQRAESLAALFFLLTLYAFIRFVEHSPGGWRALSVAACLLGMATKEVMVSTPVLLLLYDRAFVAGSFRLAWSARWRYYLSLGATWLLLAALVVGAGGRGGSAGFGTDISAWRYALTQCEAVVHYLRLSFWPYPLVFDYGTGTVGSLGAVLPQLLLLLVLLSAAAAALVKWPALGFLGAGFFFILAPSSSIVPVATQTIAEHRMYLPLAFEAAVIIFMIHTCLGRRASVAVFALAAGGAALTACRNEVYRDVRVLCADTVNYRPQNPRAHLMLGNALLEKGRAMEAITAYGEAIRLQPDYVEAYHDMGSALVRAGRPMESLPYYERALRFHAVAKSNYAYASALAQVGRLDEALVQYSKALQLQPDFVEAYNNRGNLRLQIGQAALAVSDYEQALRRQPNYPEAHLNLAAALSSLGRKPEALLHCQAGVRLKPEWAIARWKLADALSELNQWSEAIAEYKEAVRLDPNLAEASHHLGRALAQTGQVGESVAYFERALRLQPGWADVHFDFALVLEKLGRLKEAAEQDEIALRLQPALPNAAAHLARIREQGR